MTDLPTTLEPLVLRGHVIDVLRTIPAKSVQCAVTSSPYLGARSYVACTCAVGYDRNEPEREGRRRGPSKKEAHAYNKSPPRKRLVKEPDPSCPKCAGTGRLVSIVDPVWGGRTDCPHRWSDTPPRRTRAPDDAGGEIQRGNRGASYQSKGGRSCADCGAWAGMLGDETTPQMFVEHVCLVADGIWRVLRDDGTLWFNIGDSRTTHPAGLKGEKRWAASTLNNSDHTGAEQAGSFDKRGSGIPEKNLALVPQRLAIALQDRGWYVRSAVIWNKRNPGRNSAKDRPLDSHEYVFLLSKRPDYYYDEPAVRQPYVESTLREIGIAYRNESTGLYERNKAQNPGDEKRSIIDGLAERGGSRLPDVWTFATSSYKGEHFATFPEDLPEICIAAGSKPGDVVLDPFAGAGTTLMAAKRKGRRSIGVDINPEYVQQAVDRASPVEPEIAWSPPRRLTEEPVPP